MSGTVQRIDTITQLKQTPVVFSDFRDDFMANPITKDLAIVTNQKSISQSIKNLIFTNYGERFFRDIGSSVNNILFEPNDSILKDNLQYHIKSTITQYEPRVVLLAVDVFLYPDQNSISVNITYSIINTQTPQTVNVILTRVR